MTASKSLAFFGRTLLDQRLVDDVVVTVVDGTIVEVAQAVNADIPPGTLRVGGPDQIVVPGFIDMHIHGSGGCRSEDDPAGMARHVVTSGCTYVVPTVMTQSLTGMLESMVRIKELVGPISGGATIGGIHIEGPFLNPLYGAQQARHVILPSPQVVDQLIAAAGDSLSMVTIAPERKGAIDAIRQFVSSGAVAAIGHTNASEGEYAAGRTAGITHATHLFNAMAPSTWPTAKSYMGVDSVSVDEMVLTDDEITADIVCDSSLAHVPRALLELALKCKGDGDLSLITDAMHPAGLATGAYELSDGQSIVTTQGEDVVRLPDGGLCGSAMSIHGAITNLMKATKTSLSGALLMVTEAPARTLGIFNEKGSLAPGKDADIVLLDSELNIERVFIDGDEVSRAVRPTTA